ncbi:MAG: hypothetical protein ACP5MD_15750, partial [Verrucomicrobiia bacterium]
RCSPFPGSADLTFQAIRLNSWFVPFYWRCRLANSFGARRPIETCTLAGILVRSSCRMPVLMSMNVGHAARLANE